MSGFNTEYRAGGFTLIFISEYRNILFMRVLFSVFFLRGRAGFSLAIVKGMVVARGFI